MLASRVFCGSAEAPTASDGRRTAGRSRRATRRAAPAAAGAASSRSPHSPEAVDIAPHSPRRWTSAHSSEAAATARGNRRTDPRVQRAGHDVVGGQIVTDDGEDRFGGSHFHLLGDPAGTGVQRAAEHTGEGQHVVDLVREVAAPGGHDRGVPLGHLRVDLRVGVRAGEHDAVRRHRGDQLLGHLARRDPEEDVGARRAPRPCPPVSPRGLVRAARSALDGVQVVAAAVHDALGVQHGDVGQPAGQQDVGARHARPRPRRR